MFSTLSCEARAALSAKGALFRLPQLCTVGQKEGTLDRYNYRIRARLNCMESTTRGMAQITWAESQRSHCPAEMLAFGFVRGAECAKLCAARVEALQKAGKDVRAFETHNPPTALLLHGILGSGRSLTPFAQRLATLFPKWKFVLPDLPCHGHSAHLVGPSSCLHGDPIPAPTVRSCSVGVWEILDHIDTVPSVIIGHSFGGKVALDMLQQMPQSMQQKMDVWVLDSLPGEPRAGNGPNGEKDHPRDIIQLLIDVPKELACRKQLKACLADMGVSEEMANWMTTLAKAHPDGPLRFNLGLDGIVQLYEDYERTDTWDVVRSPPQGVGVSFVRADGSEYKWANGAQQQLQAAGVAVHLLSNADHNVHISNPGGLEEILAPSMRAAEVEWMRREQQHEDRFFSVESSCSVVQKRAVGGA